MADVNTYQVGQRPTVRLEFFDKDGDAADPDVVRLQIRKPDGSEAEYENGSGVTVDQVEVGVFDVDWPERLADDGSYWYRGVGDGAVETAGEHRFVVLPPHVTEAV